MARRAPVFQRTPAGPLANPRCPARCVGLGHSRTPGTCNENEGKGQQPKHPFGGGWWVRIETHQEARDVFHGHVNVTLLQAISGCAKTKEQENGKERINANHVPVYDGKPLTIPPPRKKTK